MAGNVTLQNRCERAFLSLWNGCRGEQADVFRVAALNCLKCLDGLAEDEKAPHLLSWTSC